MRKKQVHSDSGVSPLIRRTFSPRRDPEEDLLQRDTIVIDPEI